MVWTILATAEPDPLAAAVRTLKNALDGGPVDLAAFRAAFGWGAEPVSRCASRSSWAALPRATLAVRAQRGQVRLGVPRRTSCGIPSVLAHGNRRLTEPRSRLIENLCLAS